LKKEVMSPYFSQKGNILYKGGDTPMLNLFMQLVKRDNRGIAQSIVVIGIVSLVTGTLIFTIPSARNAVNNMWGVAASMVQRIDPPQSSASNTTPNPSAGSGNNQTPVSGSSSTTEPITKPVQPPAVQ
jgi:hypothetical protein